MFHALPRLVTRCHESPLHAEFTVYSLTFSACRAVLHLITNQKKACNCQVTTSRVNQALRMGLRRSFVCCKLATRFIYFGWSEQADWMVLWRIGGRSSKIGQSYFGAFRLCRNPLADRANPMSAMLWSLAGRSRDTSRSSKVPALSTKFPVISKSHQV